MNYVFFFPDEMRATGLSCYGNSLAHTPNYDRLAATGTLFENAYVQNPVCMASRCALYTGWYPHVGGYRSLLNFMPPETPNFLHELKDAGYDVRLFGKNHALDEEAIKVSLTEYKSDKPPARSLWSDSPEIQKALAKTLFSSNYSMLFPPSPDEDIEKMEDTRTVMEGVHFLESCSREKPFFLMLSINQPHAPYTCPEKFYNLCDPDKIKLKRKELEGQPSFMKLVRSVSKFETVSDETFRKCAAVYLGMISYCDMLLGRILDTLEACGLGDDTAVIVSSDHGDFAGDYGLVEKWPNAFQDDLTKVPLIIRVPGQPKGQRIKELVSEIDIFPTVLDFASAACRHDHFGKSLRPVMESGHGDSEAVIYAEGGYSIREQQCFEGTERDYKFLLRPDCVYFPKMTIQQEHQEAVCRTVMMRKKNWKLILRTSGDHELYDLSADPDEEANLYSELSLSLLRSEMKEEMLKWYIETSDVVPQFPDSGSCAPVKETNRT